MEVIPGEKKMVKDYWPGYKRRFVSLILLGQLLLAALAMLGILLGGFTTDIAILSIIGAATFTAGSLISLLLFSTLVRPFRKLLDALTHVSGEPTSIKPPNPNQESDQVDGLRPMLQLVYALAAGRDEGREDTADENAPVASKQLLTTALNQSSASMVIMNSNGDITYASRNAPVATNRNNEKELELIFENEVELSVWLKNCHDRLVHDEKQWLRIPSKIVGEDDRRIFDVTASYEKGSASEVVLMFFDRTESYQPEDEQLDFISFAAHELRGPITVIRGYLDVIQDELGDNLTPDQKTLLGRLVVSANRLSSYINNILNASRYDRRHLKVYLEERTVKTVYDIVKDDMELRASAQNRLLITDIPEDLPTIAADSSSLSEVFSNLIDNGIKYSHEGGTVLIKAYLERNFVHIEIEDHGIGMPPNVVTNLFHKFYRSHRSRETVAGTGIGLYICKAIVESHGGTIEVKSRDGRGSTFSFTVPTYESVADKIAAHQGTNKGIIRSGNEGWIKNHAKFRG